MRSATASELALLAANALAVHKRVMIKTSQGVWRNLSGDPLYYPPTSPTAQPDAAGIANFWAGGTSTNPPGGYDWLQGWDIDHDNDQPISQLVLRLARARGASPNMAQDGSFESGVPLPNSFWSASGATTLSYETSTQYPDGGLASLKVVTTSQFGAALSPLFPVTPGELWTVVAAAKSIAGKVADCQLMFLDASFTYISGIQPTTTNAAWSPLSTSGLVPAGAVWARISLQCNDVGGGTVYFDAVDVRRVALSLSPLRSDSLVNRLDDGSTFEALVDVGKAIRFEEAVTYVGVDPNRYLVTDGDLEVGTAAGWNLATGWSIDNSGNARVGTYDLKHVPGSSNVSAINPMLVRVNPGDRLYAEAYLKGVSSADGQARVRIRWLDASQVTTGTPASGDAAASDGAYHRSSVIATVPAGAAYAVAEFRIDNSHTVGTWYADSLVMVWASWKSLFEGVIDTVDVGQDPITVTARDNGGPLADTWMPSAGSNDMTASPVALETYVQSLINIAYGATPPPTLYCPVSPSVLVKTFAWNIEPLADALQRLVLGLTGWDLRYLWSDATASWRLTLYDPQRAKTTADATLGADQIIDFTKLPIDSVTVRNRITIYYGPAGDVRPSVATVDATSVSKYGRRDIVIQEASDSPIDTGTEALAMANNMLADLKDPKATISADLLPFWPVELHDLIQFTASVNTPQFNADQKLAVVHIRHSGTVADDGSVDHRTTIDCRGTPAVASWRWLYRAPAGSINQLPVTLPEYDGSYYGVPVGGTWPGIVTPNQEAGVANPGEIDYGASALTFTHPNGTKYNVPANAESVTPFEVGVTPSGQVAYIMFVGSDSTRFASIPFGSNIAGDRYRQFVAVQYYGGKWYYTDNSAIPFGSPLTPNANDCIVARITSDSTLGIGSLKRYAKPSASLDDEVTDGSTFGKVLLTALNASQVDMSKAGVINRVAANILRVAAGAHLQAIVQQLTDIGHAGSGMQESGGKALNRLLAKALAGDADSLDGLPEGSTYNRILATAATSGQVDMSKAGVINRVAANILRVAAGATLQAIIQQLTDTGHAGSGMQESGGKAINRLLAKALAGDSDSLDGTPDGATYRKIPSVVATYGPVQLLKSSPGSSIAAGFDVTFGSFTLPAGALANDGAALRIKLSGNCGSASCAAHCTIGGSTVWTLGASVIFSVEIFFVRTGASAENYAVTEIRGSTAGLFQSSGSLALNTGSTIAIDVLGHAGGGGGADKITMLEYTIEYLGV